ncbi:MAG: cryptochrome/photolyase family protein [Candidatus Woesearchaeota archaeon]
MYQKSLFIFRRDLRTHDNTALIEAIQQSKQVLACFILDPRQQNNPYFSAHAFQFMLESLQELKKEIPLQIYKGIPHTILPNIIKEHGIEAIFFNKDYTPFAQQRDEHIAQLGIPVHSYDDALLHPPHIITTLQKTPYKVFTPFYKCMSQLHVPQSNTLPKATWIQGASETLPTISKKHLFTQGGSKIAHAILQKSYHTYTQKRDIPFEQATTGLSAHLKFGTISVREVYHAFVKTYGKESSIVRQLYWRDFFTHIAFHFPHVFGHAFQQKYEHIQWHHNEQWFKRWCEGTTGFPIVDAGMRQLNQTGYMHNRVRMIVASFLTKDLIIDWRKGEQYFAQQLIDYDPAVNNGSWQWASSTGCDAQPYFRIFNPWLQQKKFDPQALYIKQWIPQLRDVPAQAIHAIETQQVLGVEYPAPIVDHYEQKQKALALFKG